MVHPAELVRSFPLERTALVLGRRDAAGISSLVHPTVSRRHVRLEWYRSAGAHLVRDLGSHNGSRLNGRRLAPDTAVELSHGDALQLGDVLAVYEIEPMELVDDPQVSIDAVPGSSVAMRRLRGTVARAGRDRSPVLLVGETGTGTEHIARELHRLSGRPGDFLVARCAALRGDRAESELFGAGRAQPEAEQPGLFRAAYGGTIFLDDVGELPLDLQAKLVHALEEYRALPAGDARPDVRVIASSSRDLVASVEAGRFRRDLYARLALWEIAVPPLRERRADLFSWIVRFHRRWLAERPPAGDVRSIQFSPAAAEAILLADWPENLCGVDRLVHELASRGGGCIEVDDLPAWLPRAPQPAEPPPPTEARPRARRATPSPEELAAAMRERDGSVRAVARHYGRDRRQIYRWIEAFGLGEYRRGRR